MKLKDLIYEPFIEYILNIYKDKNKIKFTSCDTYNVYTFNIKLYNYYNRNYHYIISEFIKFINIRYKYKFLFDICNNVVDNPQYSLMFKTLFNEFMNKNGLQFYQQIGKVDEFYSEDEDDEHYIMGFNDSDVIKIIEENIKQIHLNEIQKDLNTTNNVQRVKDELDQLASKYEYKNILQYIFNKWEEINCERDFESFLVEQINRLLKVNCHFEMGDIKMGDVEQGDVQNE